MGCDIHLHVEVKFRGKWEHWGAPIIGRNYGLFARMAGVRKGRQEGGGVEIEAIAEPRGLPKDISELTRHMKEVPGGGGSDYSWLTFEETRELVRFGEGEVEGGEGIEWFEKEFGFNPEELREEFEDIRIVFWFDG